MRVMNAQSVKCVVCAGSSSEWVRCRDYSSVMRWMVVGVVCVGRDVIV